MRVEVHSKRREKDREEERGEKEGVGSKQEGGATGVGEQESRR